MIVHRAAAAFLASTLVVLAPAPALASGAQRPARLTATPPGWLSSSPGSGASGSSSQPAGGTAGGSAGSNHPRASLPRTGFDLLPEVLAGALLMMAGLGLRTAAHRRRA
jgi:hypothetical protein